MDNAIVEQLDRIREGMLEHTDSREEVEMVESMSDSDLLALVFKHVYVAQGLEGYLLSCLVEEK